MKLKYSICIGLLMVCGLIAWLLVHQEHVESFLRKLRPPSADQIKKWAGLPEGDQVIVFTNVPGDVWYADDYVGNPGKFEWARAYEERKGSNFTCFVIAVYEPGALWPTNRAKFVHTIEGMVRDPSKNLNKEGEAVAREIGPLVEANGHKSYGFLIGLSPARFAFHPEYDVLAYEEVQPISYDKDRPPTNLTSMPTNSFSEFFTNVDTFLRSQ